MLLFRTSIHLGNLIIALGLNSGLDLERHITLLPLVLPFVAWHEADAEHIIVVRRERKLALCRIVLSVHLRVKHTRVSRIRNTLLLHVLEVVFRRTWPGWHGLNQLLLRAGVCVCVCV